MLRPMNECIETKGFAYLFIDYEWPDLVSCRVTVEDLFRGRFQAADRDQAIELFKSGDWQKKAF